MKRGQPNIDVRIRIQSKYKKNKNGCWVWTATKDKDGYGKIWLNNRTVKVSRLNYELFHAVEIPEGMVACHKCDNSSCVNPEHLFLGTQQENIEDRVSKGRTAKGSKSGKSKLNEKSVLKIRSDKRQYKYIAEDFGISIRNIIYIKQNQSWRHI